MSGSVSHDAPMAGNGPSYVLYKHTSAKTFQTTKSNEFVVCQRALTKV